MTLKLPIVGHRDAAFIRSSVGQIYLMPGGMLYAVRIQANEHDTEFRNVHIRFELTDSDHGPLYGELDKPSYRDAPWVITDMLLMPDAGPLPNVNAAHPYVLTWKCDTEFGIKSVTSYNRFPE